MKKAAVFTGIALVLTGCGGSGGETAAQPTETFAGAITFPNSAVTTLTISNIYQSSTAASGRYSLKAGSGTPTAVTITDPATGKVVMLGTLDPANSSATLDAANCAATLIFESLGGGQLSVTARATLWQTITASPKTAALGAVLTTEIGKDEFALENGNANVKASLTDAVNSLKSSIPPSLSKATLTQPQDSAAASLTIDQELQGGQTVPVVRSSGQTGYIVNGGPLEGAFFAYSVGYIDQNYVSHQTTPAVVSPEIDFAANANSAKTAPIPFDSSDQADDYTFITLSPVFDAPQPSWFTDSSYGSAPSKWSAALAPMFEREESGLISATMLEALGAPTVDWTPGSIKQVSTSLAAVNSTAATDLATAGQGKNLTSGTIQYLGIPAGSEADAFTALAAIAPLISVQAPDLSTTLATKSLSSAQVGAFRGHLRVLTTLGSLGISNSIGRLATEYSTGQLSRRIFAQTGVLPLTLTPDTGNFQPGVNLPITVAHNPAYTHAFTYTWSLDPIFTTASQISFTDGQGHTGTSITTSSTSVSLVSSSTSTGTARVIVTGQTTDDSGTQLTLKAPPADFVANGLVKFTVQEFSNNFYAIASVPKPSDGHGGWQALKIQELCTETGGLPGTFQGGSNFIYSSPAFSGTPIPSTTEPFSTGKQLQPIGGGISGSGGGVDAFDFGDRIELSLGRSGYDPTISGDRQRAQNWEQNVINNSQVKVVIQ